MKQQKLLIATTNQGKFKEITHFLADLPFQLISLSDLNKKIKAPAEDGKQIKDNAIIKATYYGEKTSLFTLADDTGLFITALHGWPGVKSVRIDKIDSLRRKAVLDKLKKMSNNNRRADFCEVLSLFDPFSKNIFLTYGETAGRILKNEVQTKNGFGYDSIFYVPTMKKTYAEMTVAEKNSCSHRGKALIKMKYILQNHYGAKHIVVPIALIIKDGQLLITLRNDPHRPETDKKWELPGGIVDFGETVESAVIKEVKEEAGYKVKIIKQLQGIKVKDHQFPNFRYQVYLVPFVCKIIGGDGKFNDAEVLDAKWIKPEHHRQYEFLTGDNDYLDELMLELKEIIKKYNL